MSISRKTPEQIQAMRQGGRILSRIVHELSLRVRPGMRTNELDAFTRSRMSDYKVKPSFLGYLNFPAVVCLSINDEAVHGVPSERKIQDGDILKIDMGVEYEGLHTDMAVTVLATDASQFVQKFGRRFAEHRRLMSATKNALSAGIRVARPGNSVKDIGRAIQDVLKKKGCTILKELGGHGIGEIVHEEPFVPNWDDQDANTPLVPGMTLALEPIASLGTSWEIKDGEDGFTYKTKDGSLAAHFEHTIVITENRAEILTT